MTLKALEGQNLNNLNNMKLVFHIIKYSLESHEAVAHMSGINIGSSENYSKFLLRI